LGVKVCAQVRAREAGGATLDAADACLHELLDFVIHCRVFRVRGAKIWHRNQQEKTQNFLKSALIFLGASQRVST
jgi:hypothetical protein